MAAISHHIDRITLGKGFGAVIAVMLATAAWGGSAEAFASETALDLSQQASTEQTAGTDAAAQAYQVVSTKLPAAEDQATGADETSTDDAGDTAQSTSAFSAEDTVSAELASADETLVSEEASTTTESGESSASDTSGASGTTTAASDDSANSDVTSITATDNAEATDAVSNPDSADNIDGAVSALDAAASNTDTPTAETASETSSASDDFASSPADVSVSASSNDSADTSDSSEQVTGWVTEDGGTYYYQDGVKLTGEQLIDGSWYYLDPPNGGVLVTGFARVASSDTAGSFKTAYYDENGRRVSGTLTIDGTTYRFDETSGAMLTGFSWDGDAIRYYDLSSGAMLTGLHELHNGTRYFDEDGSMATGTTAVQSGEIISFDSFSGVEQFGSQSAVLESAYSTPTTAPGYCSEWISYVFENAGLPLIGGDARQMCERYCFTSDRQLLVPGMIVAVTTSGLTSDSLEYGHIGIYVGNNTIMDSVGYIRVMSLDEWSDLYGDLVEPLWGWFGGYVLL